MKKFFIILSILTIFMSIDVFASDNDQSGWIDWSPHNYNTYDNPQIGGGTYGQYSPWYVCYSDENQKGVVVKYVRSGNYPPMYFYLSKYNTFKGYLNYNNYGNNSHSVPEMVTYNLSMLTTSSSWIGGILNTFNISDPIYYTTLDLSSYNPLVVDNYDVSITSIDDLYSQMQDLNFQSGWTDPNAPDSNNLPMLTYGLTKKTVVGFPQITQIKEILTWDYTEHDVYKNNPTDFYMEMVASVRFSPAPTGIGNIRDTSDNSINQNLKVPLTNGGCNISANQYSWIYREIGKSLYAVAGEPWDDNSGYFLYVRTCQSSTDKKSAWKVYNLALNGLVVQEDTYIEPDGTQKQLPNDQKDIGNGQGVQPAKFDNDSSTSSDSDPTSVRYDEGAGNFNAGTVIATLKSTVNQIGELPTVLSQLLSFMPSWMTNLMILGIAFYIRLKSS